MSNKMNRYEKTIHHKNELKRRITPKHFYSYESYLNYSLTPATEWEANWIDKHHSNGILMYAETYWKAYSGWCNPGWKKNAKHFNNRGRRATWRAMISQYDVDDEGFDELPHFRRGMQYEDRWNWDW